MKHSKGDTIFDKKLGKWMTFDGEKFIPETEWHEIRDGVKPDAKPAPQPAPVQPVLTFKKAPKAPEPEPKPLPEPEPKPKPALKKAKGSKPPKKRR